MSEPARLCMGCRKPRPLAQLLAYRPVGGEWPMARFVCRPGLAQGLLSGICFRDWVAGADRHEIALAEDVVATAAA